MPRNKTRKSHKTPEKQQITHIPHYAKPNASDFVPRDKQILQQCKSIINAKFPDYDKIDKLRSVLRITTPVRHLEIPSFSEDASPTAGRNPFASG